MIKMRNKRTIVFGLTPYALVLMIFVLALVSCSGSKVTTKSSAELPRYQIRILALVPFTTLATPQVREVADQAFSVPPGVRRSDMAISVPPTFRRSVTGDDGGKTA